MKLERISADLAIIGAGSGGLSVAAGAAQLGLKVVLFEKGEMGGDCLNYGCVPSKALIAAADAAHAAAHSGPMGVSASGVSVDFAAVMARVHRVIAEIAPIDSQERFESLGVRVVREAARFRDRRVIESDSVRVTARKVVIATGSRAAIPPIPGLDGIPYLTNESIFELKARPDHLIVLGGGPIGVELGQAFRRLGAEVTLIEAEAILGRDDPAAAAVVIEQLRADGLTLLPGHRAVRVEAGPTVIVSGPDGERRIEGSHLLVALGRKASLDSLNLEAAGVVFDRAGVKTDRSLRTSNRRVFAIGDAAGRGQFTHLAGAHAGLFVRKALFAAPINADALVVPRVTYSNPELAAVGLTEAQAREAHGDDVRVLVQPFADNDRAQAEGDIRGFAKLIASRRGKVLGVTLVGAHAGDHLPLWVLTMTAGLKLSQLTGMIASYPTRGEINKRLAGQWFTGALFSPATRRLVSVLKRFG
ncbi:dihydrolipoyl dehydrogenase family protein (plasmid) [Caulobacter sp. ErkDOM-YI]|uniref:dihydrolipoyl dehydrogenase family protein n=1 Tax=unclassified Caulobacter TaxID=2648921 RepID=UPI003AF52458